MGFQWDLMGFNDLIHIAPQKKRHPSHVMRSNTFRLRYLWHPAWPWSWLLWVFTLFLIHIPISLDQIPIIRYKSPIDSHRTIGWCWLSITNNNSWTMLNVMFKNSKTAHFPIPWVMENSIEKSPVIHVVPWIIHDYSHSHQFHPFFLLSNPDRKSVV